MDEGSHQIELCVSCRQAKLVRSKEKSKHPEICEAVTAEEVHEAISFIQTQEVRGAYRRTLG